MKTQWKSLLTAIAIPLATGFLSSFLSAGGMQTFAALNKPPLSPPGWLFPVVWTILYILMGVSSWLIWKDTPRCPEAKDGLLLYGIQLIFNFFWSIIFFRFRLYFPAFIWLLGLIFQIVSCIRIFAKCSKTASNLLIPYLIWCMFASYLNLGIFLLN